MNCQVCGSTIEKQHGTVVGCHGCGSVYRLEGKPAYAEWGTKAPGARKRISGAEAYEKDKVYETEFGFDWFSLIPEATEWLVLNAIRTYDWLTWGVEIFYIRVEAATWNVVARIQYRVVGSPLTGVEIAALIMAVLTLIGIIVKVWFGYYVIERLLPPGPLGIPKIVWVASGVGIAIFVAGIGIARARG